MLLTRVTSSLKLLMLGDPLPVLLVFHHPIRIKSHPLFLVFMSSNTFFVVDGSRIRFEIVKFIEQMKKRKQKTLFLSIHL